MATSLAGVPFTPQHPGQDKFKGAVMHSTDHDSSKAWVGKKVLVVGTSQSDELKRLSIRVRPSGLPIADAISLNRL
jgi:hypothetical protein